MPLVDKGLGPRPALLRLGMADVEAGCKWMCCSGIGFVGGESAVIFPGIKIRDEA